MMQESCSLAKFSLPTPVVPVQGVIVSAKYFVFELPLITGDQEKFQFIFWILI